jgi:DNA-binding NarL/FixJ family response regulator
MTLGLATKIFSENEWLQLSNELYLSPRQAEIVKCILWGCSDKQIARELQISVATVRTHLSRLFSKLNIQDRSELILYVFGYFREKCKESGCHTCQLHHN